MAKIEFRMCISVASFQRGLIYEMEDSPFIRLLLTAKHAELLNPPDFMDQLEKEDQVPPEGFYMLKPKEEVEPDGQGHDQASTTEPDPERSERVDSEGPREESSERFETSPGASP